jgi:phosphatidylserine decarboxylase
MRFSASPVGRSRSKRHDDALVSFAREGLVFIAIAALIAAAIFAAALNRRSWPLWLFGFTLTILALWVAYFFRDPERTGPRGAQFVIAPADGEVVLINDVDEPSFMGRRARRVSIFMNVFNVHVNRYPVTGTVRFVHYNPGKFLNAAVEKSSLENEQMSVGIETAHSRVLVRQIAGLIARRIVTYSKPGEHVEQGERMGLIRFGSRVDVFLPLDAQLRVKLGDMTLAGTTPIAELAAP